MTFAAIGGDHLRRDQHLFEAGASAVVVSITRAADDATHAFMTTYHHRRVAGAPPAIALQETQHAMLVSNTYPPAMWAGFIVYGS